MKKVKFISEKSYQRKRFSEAEKAAYCLAWKESKKPVSKFCEEKGLSPQTFYRWLNGKTNKEKPSQRLFIPVETQIDKSRQGESLRIKFPNGYEIYFSEIKDEEKVVRLLEGLQNAIVAD